MSKTNRREFLIKSAPFVAAPLLLPLMNRASALSFARYDIQGGWRYCDKCSALIYKRTPSDTGRCPAGGGHNAQGYDFRLPYGNNLSDLPTAQTNWRYCDKCSVMFWDGIADKGRCPAGGGHNAQGFLFRLPHDVNIDANNQGAWRFCQKCKVMFYDGYPGKGNCAAGGGHVAQGYVFVLPHGAEVKSVVPKVPFLWVNYGEEQDYPGYRRVEGGMHVDGHKMYVCKVADTGGWPGNLYQNTCFLPGTNGESQYSSNYQILLTNTQFHWKPVFQVSAAEVANHAIVGGQGYDREILYVCRKQLNDGTHVGEYKLSEGLCHIQKLTFSVSDGFDVLFP